MDMDQTLKFSISNAMTNGAEMRCKNKKMEMRKRDVVFVFLLTNSDNCGFLFSIDGQRTISKSEKALVVQKHDMHNEKNVKENKKVTFDEKSLNYNAKSTKNDLK